MRQFAHVKTTIWDDPAFVDLEPEAQRLYFQLLTQKRLSMVGVMAYTPRNWARQCADLEVEDIEATVRYLIDRRFVLVDADTEELLIRTTVKHDPPRGSKSIKGMWNAWSMVDSKPLRRAILDELGPEILDDSPSLVPDEAKALRNAPSDAPSMPLSCSGDSNVDSTTTTTNHNHQPHTTVDRTDFERFWNQYPRKVGKAKAQTSWGRLNTTDRADALAALPSHVRSWKDKDEQYIPHPTTWLNGRRWEDEVAEPKHKGPVYRNGIWIEPGVDL